MAPQGVWFTERPRERAEELFDMKSEFNIVRDMVMRGNWVVILGPRMSGKTSLAKAVMNSVNWRGVYVDLINIGSFRRAIEQIYLSTPRGIRDELAEALKAIGVRVTTISIDLTLTRRVKPIASLILNSLCRERTILVLDEVQDVRNGVAPFLALLHNLFNSCSNLSVIFTGSAVGLVNLLINPKPDSPLYGRPPVQVRLNPWSEGDALEYLKLGLTNCNTPFNEGELREVLSELGTLVGWLNFYGVRRCGGARHADALRETLTEASKIAAEQIRRVTGGSTWRVRVLRAMAFGARWRELRDVANVSETALTNYLNQLINTFIVSRVGELYVVRDPVYRQVILNLFPP